MRKPINLKVFKLIENGMNRLKLREKIIGLFIFCVIIPLICTDGIILKRILTAEKTEALYTAQNLAGNVTVTLSDQLLNCEKIAVSVAQNDNVGEFLAKRYKDNYEYYESYVAMTGNYFFQTLVGFDNTKIKLYSSNDTLTGGGYIGILEREKDTEWYKMFEANGFKPLFVCVYDTARGHNESKRNIYYLQQLNYPNNEFFNFIRVNIDYSTFSRKIVKMGYPNTIYVCDGDTILMSNKGMNNHNDLFDMVGPDEDIIYQTNVDLLGNMNQIKVLSVGGGTLDLLLKNKGLILLLILINLLLPALAMYGLDYSIIHRIQKLDNVFGKRENDVLVKIDNPEGTDEIGNLMMNYNNMADEVNRLVQVVYKDKLYEQEVNLARQNAELLALHSQINPHFMFNALESIRMHSIIKGENETAEMVEKLALMERQYVDWGSDMIEIKNELSSVEAYLGLQKYRFGDKLMFELDIDEDCERLLVPKLTIVTFVENACVHGMENKNTNCWVFVRVYRQDDNIIIEVEDTGNGINDEMLALIREKSKTIEIDDIKNMKHVGIFNAILRLKMTMGEDYTFEIESEEGVGTMISISIPSAKRTDSEEVSNA